MPNAPLANNQRQYIVKQVSLGKTKAQIIDMFEEKYGRRINPTTITRVKKANINVITETRQAIAAEGAVSAQLLKQKSYQLIERRLDRAIQDEDALIKLRNQLRAGKLDEAEYKRKATLYEELTISELTKVADSMHLHTKGKDDDDPAMTPADAAAFQLLLEGVRNGNPLTLVQVLNPRAAAENQQA